jgi:hypothetical protein
MHDTAKAASLPGIDGDGTARVGAGGVVARYPGSDADAAGMTWMSNPIRRVRAEP